MVLINRCGHENLGRLECDVDASYRSDHLPLAQRPNWGAIPLPRRVQRDVLPDCPFAELAPFERAGLLIDFEQRWPEGLARDE